MLKRNLKLIIGIITTLIAIFVIIQLIPFGKNHTNPPVVREPNWDSQQTRILAKTACFDCHSNETIWPWYSNIAPISWIIYYDTVNGRRRLNFSDWGNIRLHETGEIAELIASGEMPPLQYLIIHTTARLTAQEKSQLINGLFKTIGQ